MNTITLGDRVVGPGAPVLVIAEAGVNHDGDLQTALDLVDAAADAGAGAVKFQTFETDQLATPEAPLANYQSERGALAGSQRELLQSLELGAGEFAAIAQRCAERHILFLSSPFDIASANLLAQLGVPGFKVGSGELTNLPFLSALSEFGLPLLVSTGMATLEEVADAVAVVSRAEVGLILLHCVSSYPAPPDEANLHAIDTLRTTFGLPIGYSDHCLGPDVTLSAVARDACVVERHLTLDRRRVGPDHAISLEPAEMADLVRRIRSVEGSLGDGRKRPQPSEFELRTVARRSIVAARQLKAGELVTPDSLAAKRPATGLPPNRARSLIGRRLTRAIAPNEPISESDVADPA